MKKKIGQKKNWQKKKLAEKKIGRKKTSRNIGLPHLPYRAVCKKMKILGKIYFLFYILCLKHLFQPSLNSSVGRACRSCPEDWGSIPP
jgi:hypothetical protein